MAWKAPISRTGFVRQLGVYLHSLALRCSMRSFSTRSRQGGSPSQQLFQRRFNGGHNSKTKSRGARFDRFWHSCSSWAVPADMLVLLTNANSENHH
jgi:hypothetical protein